MFESYKPLKFFSNLEMFLYKFGLKLSNLTLGVKDIEYATKRMKITYVGLLVSPDNS